MALLGRQLTIGKSDDLGAFALLCVTAQRSLEINNEEIDITKPDCASPGSKLVAAFMYGLQTMRFQGQCAFVDNATMKDAVASAVEQVIDTYQVTVPGVGTFEGDALLSVTFTGDKTNELQADFRFAMSGDIAFTAVAP